ncbi:sister chromatid cohesion protein PDS5 homolog C [Cucumis melo]|uniref:Sister chromatid cohesion protein PDS5 homolog C n=1 Tax=Cucumis melo TaxID=3656 RepID=A0A1S3BC85_CUCME|nr:sister chromatid cohesion protein PDS5 homolog C [Cucumis melo]
MASSDKDVEEQLLEAGNKIVDPPTSVEELLPLLDKIESLLAKVEQSPSISMQVALTPSLKALVSDQLLRHSDIDVKVSVAACISEITRITAPDAPYNDEQMKEVFHLIVSSFENLSEKSSRSYAKRASILETVAKVRSCVVMLDLECDGLIIEMFQHFFKTIRDYHPENVFSSMETIMSLVLEESEDMAVGLLSPILESVKKDNEEILPIARKLGERVLNNCSTKLKPYLVQAVKTLGISFDDYSDVVASICKDLSGSLEPSNLHDAGENVVEEKPTEVATPERVDTGMEKHHDSVKSNGVAQGGEDGSVSTLENKKEEHGEECKEVKSPKSPEPANLGSEKASNVKERSEKSSRKKGKKSNQSSKSTEISHVDSQKGSESQPERDSHSEHPGSPRDDQSAENLPLENEADAKPSSPKAMEIESANVASPSLSESVPDECNNKSGQGSKVGQAKRKGNSVKEVAASSAEVSKKSSDGMDESGAKLDSDAEEKVPAGVSDDTKPAAEDAGERESDTTSDFETKTLKQSARKGDGSSKSSGSSLKQSEVKRKKGSGKSSSGKNVKSVDDDKKETTPVQKPASKNTKDEKIVDKTPTTVSKRKRTPVKEKESETKGFDESLVGSKIKVWWPKDRMFYEGVVESFDRGKKKHKVLYTDGDEEILNLKKEKWQYIDDESESEQEETADLVRSESAVETPQKKKAKQNANESAKRGKMDASPKKGGGTSSSKSKGAATKTDRSSGSKVESKLKETTPKGGRHTAVTGSKSKDQGTPKTGSKPGSTGPKIAGKSKNDDAESNKTSKSKDDETSTPAVVAKSIKQDVSKTGKSKQETPKTPVSKGKSTKTGDKSSNTNLSTKVKFTSSKAKEKESGDVKNSSTSGKTMENSKGKSLNSSNDQGSESKSGKKRRRESKG